MAAPADLDRVLNSLTSDFNKFRTSWGQTMTSVQKTFTTAEATVKSMVTSSGGSAISTLTGSLELVGIQLTRFFIPTIVMASQGLQDLAGWLDDLSPEGRKTVTQFAEIAGAGVVVVATMRALGLSISPIVLAFGALLVAMQLFTKWLDSKIEERNRKFVEAAAQQYTRAEVEASPEFKKVQGMSPAERNNYLSREIASLEGQIKKSQESRIEGGVLNPGLRFGPTDETNRLLKQQAMLSAIRRTLVFGEQLPETVAPPPASGLGGGFGIGGLLQMFMGGGGNLLSGLGGGGGAGGGGRRRFAFNFPNEMQPRISSVEEARKQFQLQALKSPLEQQLMQDLRKMSQDFISEASNRSRAWDVLANIGSFLGFR